MPYYRVAEIRYFYGSDVRRIYVEETSGPAKHYQAHNDRFTIEVTPFYDRSAAEQYCAELKKYREASA